MSARRSSHLVDGRFVGDGQADDGVRRVPSVLMNRSSLRLRVAERAVDAVVGDEAAQRGRDGRLELRRARVVAWPPRNTATIEPPPGAELIVETVGDRRRLGVRIGPAAGAQRAR